MYVYVAMHWRTTALYYRVYRAYLLYLDSLLEIHVTISSLIPNFYLVAFFADNIEMLLTICKG